MSDTASIATWACQALKLTRAPINESNPITVGEKFLLVCEGSGVDLNSSKLTLELPKNAKYALRIIETRRLEAGRGEFVATTWVGQPLNFPHLILTDSANKVDLGPLAIAVKSSIPQEMQQEPKPFDPFGPVKLGLPTFVWMTIAVVLVFAVIWGVWVGRKIVKRKRLKTLLAKNQIALSPFNQFNKDLRRIVRAGSTDLPNSMQDLRESFRWFLTRDLVIPALNESPKQILKEIATKHPRIWKPLKRDLSLALTELDKAVTGGASSDEADLNQLTDLCRTLADRMQRLKEA